MAKAIISSTYDDKYLWFLPLVTWCWNKIGVDVICFAPISRNPYECYNGDLVLKTLQENNLRCSMQWFFAPKHKEATYAQNLRNYASAIKELDENELLCTSDVDMMVFQKPPYNGMLTIWGNDLVPQGQFPMCYINGTVKQWREAFDIGGRTYQKCIDDQLGDDECEHYRGNRWATDQENSFKKISKVNHSLVPRAKEGTQWATHRYDRDDAYILERLNLDTVDYHMNRPGYEDRNLEIILTILKYHYPQDDFTWLINYNNEYKQLL